MRMIQARGRAAELPESRLRRIHELMLTARLLEGRLVEAVRAGEVPGELFPGLGQEAALIGFACALDDGDVFSGAHRDLAALLGRGITVEQLVLNAYGRGASPSGGRDGGIGLGDPGRGVLMVEPAGPANHQVAVGCAMAIAARGEARVVMVSCGEGATAEGSWHEAVNAAAALRLPVVFAVQSNGFAGRVRSAAVSALEYVAHRADGYGVPGVVVDGTDVLECYSAAAEAADRAREGGGPTVVEAVSFRRLGHSAADDVTADPDEIEAWEGRDPIDRFEEYLGVRGMLDEAGRTATRERIGRLVEDTIEWASRADEGEPAALRVFAEGGREPPPVSRPPGTMTMRAALRHTLDAEMGRDEAVVVIGRDARAGGSHDVTAGLMDRYGPTRVFDVPGGAAAAVGAGIGAALEGLLPVVEIPDRGLGEALRLLGGWAGRHHWKTGHPVPLVVRVASRPGGAPAPETLVAGVPGVRVVVASTPETAAGLLAAAIRDPNPVVLIEPERLYEARGPVPGDVRVPLGRARVVRRGSAVTLVAWGAGVAVALEACRSDDTVEVVDLLSIAPLDWATVSASLQRTSRLVVLDEGPPAGGVAAELAGRAAADALWALDGPVAIVRPSGADAPFSPIRADAHLLTPVQVAEAVRSITSV